MIKEVETDNPDVFTLAKLKKVVEELRKIPQHPYVVMKGAVTKQPLPFKKYMENQNMLYIE